MHVKGVKGIIIINKLLKEWWYKTFHGGGTGSQNLHHNNGVPGKLDKEE